MYKTGDLSFFSKPCKSYDKEDGSCSDHEYGSHALNDSREGYQDILGPGVYLAPSDDYWIIGGPEQIRTMIADLQKALELMGER